MNNQQIRHGHDKIEDMEKKIKVTLSPVAAKYFALVQYGLDYGKGVCTQSQVINHCLEEPCAFEDITDD